MWYALIEENQQFLLGWSKKKDQVQTIGWSRSLESINYATSPGHRKPLGKKYDPEETVNLPLPETFVQQKQSASAGCLIFAEDYRSSLTSISIFFVFKPS